MEIADSKSLSSVEYTVIVTLLIENLSNTETISYFVDDLRGLGFVSQRIIESTDPNGGHFNSISSVIRAQSDVGALSGYFIRTDVDESEEDSLNTSVCILV